MVVHREGDDDVYCPCKRTPNMIKVINQDSQAMLIPVSKRIETSEGIRKRLEDKLTLIFERKSADPSFIKQRLEEAIELCDKFNGAKQEEKGIIGRVK